MQINETNKKKYCIVFICMLIQAIPFGIAQNIQLLFIPHVVNEYGFTLSGFSLIFTIGALALSIASPILGKLFDKIGIKTIFLVGRMISSFGFFMFSTCTSLPTFYFWNAVCQIGCVFFSSLGLPYLIQHCFPKKGRGKALGIAFVGGSIGNIFLQQITENLLSIYRPSTTYLIFGIVSAVFSLPAILFFIRIPKSKEIESNEVLVENKVKSTNEPGFEGLGAKEITKNPIFWIFSVGYAYSIVINSRIPMNIIKLEIFYKTAKYLNMSKVAKEIYISQPSIS